MRLRNWTRRRPRRTTGIRPPRYRLAETRSPECRLTGNPPARYWSSGNEPPGYRLAGNRPHRRIGRRTAEPAANRPRGGIADRLCGPPGSETAGSRTASSRTAGNRPYRRIGQRIAEARSRPIRPLRLIALRRRRLTHRSGGRRHCPSGCPEGLPSPVSLIHTPPKSATERARLSIPSAPNPRTPPAPSFPPPHPSHGPQTPCA
jgi:hypothetical protein